MTTWLGIDFSGNHLQWRAGLPEARANVWIAAIRDDALADLRPVQALPGDGTPFVRLASLLREGAFAAAAIDAPFSVPARCMKPGGRAALLDALRALPCPDRPFPHGTDLIAACLPPVERKPHRQTELAYAGLNVRSTLWNGARPGAPFTAACLTLLAASGAPCWPWVRKGPGLVAEGFPAGQLQEWGWREPRYGDPRAGIGQRQRIVAKLGAVLDLGRWADTLATSPDALDATIIALTARHLAQCPLPPADCDPDEGWIAVAPAPT